MALGVARRGWLDFPALSGSSWCGRCGSGPEWKREIAKYAIMGASNVMRLGEGGEGRR